ncbi:MAG: formylglycine-generating enzyme family protein [Elusimicrobiales bacterium]|nr:formylglycine-generating enzyme family protein [Elusimicrobiales bacterium]
MASNHRQGAARCPHCGKPAGQPGGLPGHVILSGLMLAAAAFFYFSPERGAGQPAATDLPGGGRLTEQRVSYMLSADGAKECSPCLAAADKFARDRRQAALAARTRGMALIPAGEYRIGSPDGVGDPDERPRHKVHLDAFYLDAREVTISDYMKFANKVKANYPEWAEPGGDFNVETGPYPHYKRVLGLINSCQTCPVIGVEHRDAAAYCAWAGKRLPTEAEWEAAARGGTETVFSFGDSAKGIGAHAWYEGNSMGLPRPVGGKAPNAYGLYDMHGNVWEWTADFYEKRYYDRSPGASPTGPENGGEKVLRGGSWAFDPGALRAGNRASSAYGNDDIGFRCAAGKADIDLLVDGDLGL